MIKTKKEEQQLLVKLENGTIEKLSTKLSFGIARKVAGLAHVMQHDEMQAMHMLGEGSVPADVLAVLDQLSLEDGVKLLVEWLQSVFAHAGEPKASSDTFGNTTEESF